MSCVWRTYFTSMVIVVRVTQHTSQFTLRHPSRVTYCVSFRRYVHETNISTGQEVDTRALCTLVGNKILNN